MPKRGDIARERVKNTIMDAFSATNDLICVQDKKIYVQARDGDNGEVIQFAISMTMPKTQVVAAGPATWYPGGSPDSEQVSMPIKTVEPVEMSPEDKAAVERLKRALGVV